MAALEQNHKTRSLKLAAFERNFKEDAAREQQLAIENISEILRNLTLKQTSMVSWNLSSERPVWYISRVCDKKRLIHNQVYDQVTNASRKVDESSSQDNEKLLKDLSDMVQITNDGKRDVNEYMETSKIHYAENTFISTENRAVMENCLEEW
ncbi:hypothetical protein HanOQP8_Chr01g0033111 [Helianthus annuus]|nr:hypothetical protein HanOQP8_Chr01g0033111 [Helianthus annuus]